ncbi:hypothetical protein C8Q80DRAFT_339995 [Daedaleopsis nitida]|nr:hypothetical protein C8Q80DRAFT_339995 [Daedaleopsis nitida]
MMRLGGLRPSINFARQQLSAVAFGCPASDSLWTDRSEHDEVGILWFVRAEIRSSSGSQQPALHPTRTFSVYRYHSERAAMVEAKHYRPLPVRYLLDMGVDRATSATRRDTDGSSLPPLRESSASSPPSRLLGPLVLERRYEILIAPLSASSIPLSGSLSTNSSLKSMRRDDLPPSSLPFRSACNFCNAPRSCCCFCLISPQSAPRSYSTLTTSSAFESSVIKAWNTSPILASICGLLATVERTPFGSVSINVRAWKLERGVANVERPTLVTKVRQRP